MWDMLAGLKQLLYFLFMLLYFNGYKKTAA